MDPYIEKNRHRYLRALALFQGWFQFSLDTTHDQVWYSKQGLGVSPVHSENHKWNPEKNWQDLMPAIVEARKYMETSKDKELEKEFAQVKKLLGLAMDVDMIICHSFVSVLFGQCMKELISHQKRMFHHVQE